MYCGKCGKELSSESKFCSFCGAKVITEEMLAQVAATAEQASVETEVVVVEPGVDAPVYVETPVEEPVVNPEQEQAKKKAAKDTLLWGILSLAFAIEGAFVSFLGIIFACTAFKKANWFKYLNNGTLEGKAKLGHTLAKAGLIAGIVMTVIMAIYGLVLLVELIAGIGGSIDMFDGFDYY